MPIAANPSVRDLLEPCAGKLACTVLRGRVGGNTDLLPDIMMGSKALTLKNIIHLAVWSNWPTLFENMAS